MKIQLASDLALSVDAVTQKFAILGVSGSGKTTTGTVLFEQLVKAQCPTVVLDLTDAWWGVQSSKDGKSEGLPVAVLGGKHGNIQLEEGAGKMIADMVVEQLPQIVLSLRNMSTAGVTRFVTDFCERLYAKNDSPIHLFIDEIDRYAPQKLSGDDATRLFKSVDEIVRRGRNRGIGVTMICQRAALVNKDILTQAEVLIAHRSAHPLDVAPITAWMDFNGTPSQLVDVRATLAKLQNGEAWVMSAQWLKVFRRVQMDDRTTFNSSATPKFGERRVIPKRLAAVDIAALGARMAETIERQKASDPVELRREIARLKTELAAKPAAGPATEIRVPVIDKSDLLRLEALQATVSEDVDELTGTAQDLAKASAALAASITKIAAGFKQATPPDVLPRPNVSAPRHPVPNPSKDTGTADLPKGARALLEAAIQHTDGVYRDQLTVICGYKRSSRDTYLQRLFQLGFIEEIGNRIYATAAGRAAQPNTQPLPTGEALRSHWLSRLGGGERVILEQLIAKYPNRVNRDEIEGYKRSSRDTFIQKLSSRRLIVATGPGVIQASPTLFGE